MARALVTGGAGFLGSHVAERLLEMGLDVVVLDDLSGGFRRNVPDGASFEEGSVVDVDRVDEIFRDGSIRYVFHLAAYAAEGLSHFIRRFNYTDNLMGSANLINASIRHEVECFVFTSSAAVYGATTGPVRESRRPAPEDPYGVAKLAIEQDLAAARRQFGMRSVVFRPHNVYGERQNLSDPYRNVVGIFMRQVLEGRPCTIFGDGEQVRAFSHVADVAPVIASSIEVEAALDETFNIGSDVGRSVKDLAEMTQQALGREVGLEHLPPRNEAREVTCDHACLREVFGKRETVDLAAGLDRMATWARTIEPRAPRPFARVELTRGLPPSWHHLLDDDGD